MFGAMIVFRDRGAGVAAAGAARGSRMACRERSRKQAHGSILISAHALE